MIETSVLPRKSSEIFRQCSETFVWPSDDFKRIFVSQKSVKNVVISMFNNRQNITCPFVDTNFILSCSTRYLTSEHIKLNTQDKIRIHDGHVISSTYETIRIVNVNNSNNY